MNKYTSYTGYAASSVLVISFIFTKIDNNFFLYLNTLGCFLFVIYGYLLNKNYAIMIPNVFIFFLNLYNLFFQK